MVFILAFLSCVPGILDVELELNDNILASWFLMSGDFDKMWDYDSARVRMGQLSHDFIIQLFLYMKNHCQDSHYLYRFVEKKNIFKTW